MTHSQYSAPQLQEEYPVDDSPSLDMTRDTLSVVVSAPSRVQSPIDVDMLPDVTGPEIQVSRVHKKTITHQRICPGLIISLPLGASPHSAYPFGLHDELGDPWDYSVTKGVLVLRSRACSTTESDRKCRDCEELENNPNLRGVLERMERGVKQSTQLVYHGIGGLVKIIRGKTGQVRALKLNKLNTAKKLVRKGAALDAYKELLMALGSGNMQRVDRFIRACRDRKRGVHGMLDILVSAGTKVYRTQNFTEEDALQGLLLWRLGGARVAGIAHRSMGLPSLNTLRRRTIIPTLLASSGQPTRVEIEKNIAACFESINELVGNGRVVHQVLMFDELKVEERPRWDDKTNMIVGICREHGSNTSLEYNSKQEVELLIHSIQKDIVHLATEVCVGQAL